LAGGFGGPAGVCRFVCSFGGYSTVIAPETAVKGTTARGRVRRARGRVLGGVSGGLRGRGGVGGGIRGGRCGLRTVHLPGLTVIGRRADGARETDGVARVAIVTQNAGALLASVRSLV
jgi:hypothetical protein